MRFLRERRFRILDEFHSPWPVPVLPKARQPTCPCTSSKWQLALTGCLLSKRVQWQPWQTLLVNSWLPISAPPLKHKTSVTPCCLPSPCFVRLPSYLEGCFSFLPVGPDLKSNHLVLFVLSVNCWNHTPQHRGLCTECAVHNAPGSPV